VDNAQRPERQVLGVAVAPERERVPAVEPTDLRAPALGGLADRDHARILQRSRGPNAYAPALPESACSRRFRFNSASMNSSRCPSSTYCGLPTSCPVRWSFTRLS